MFKQFISPYTHTVISKKRAIDICILTGQLATIETMTVSELKTRFPEMYKKVPKLSSK